MTSLTTKPKVRWTPRTLTILFFWWLGGMRPAMARHYLTDALRCRLVKSGVPSRTAKHVAEVSAEFEAKAAQGQFQERWFDMNIVPWCVTFPKVFHRTDAVRILEIGSWEGRSSLFFLTYFAQGKLTAVDTWAGSDEWHYNATPDLRDLEARFDTNVSSGAGRVTKRKGSSLTVLPQLISERQEFDLIYVDGSHLSDDAIVDGLNAWRLLKQGGIIIFDDVMWPAYPRARANTAWAIHQFLKYHPGEYKVLHAQYQIILQKKSAFVDETADWVSKPPAPAAVSDPSNNGRQPEQSHQQVLG
ncbi:class I SAM-dependent methyltransferase [Mycobacterium sp. 852002-53434_SCH5985345]|uniref:class I SAM-dependent methyltransferase n=1 Tax=Mycobacterium sp. 852002-53434_SCH5985345 TaxID=1834107 RepID=UPI0009ED078F|nr:class I SAM-dependent methyltransferase [Mycobacterium sp. 852002-53434_SCH5985345]